ncbi:hypothetical protein LTR53_016586 [Teratosphaeriaceae sp. CCFEE 6253]|nr:hypothetical protein LTR53_016586 [Teratosphaeriaceae sp. CCFEE 6253]
MTSFSLSASGLILSVLVLAGYWLYRSAIPTPIPGIPYVKRSATRPLGDFPDAVKYNAKTRELTKFLVDKCVELDSPVVQVFMRPFSRPAQDILARRTREFDRSNIFGDMFVSTIPHSMTVHPTDEQWRDNRRLMADNMSTPFLHDVAAPQEHAVFTSLLALWRTKSSLAWDHAFEVTSDIDEALLDSIISVAFGTSTGVTQAQQTLLAALPQLAGLSTQSDDAAVFPTAARPPTYEAITTLGASTEIGLKSPFGRHHHAFALKYYPKLRKAMRVKEALITERLQTAWNKFNAPEASEDDVKSACNLIVAREVALAKKQGRAPQYNSPIVRDELYGFLQAGFDTAAGTVKWGVKFLTRHQDVQKKLRQSLHSAFGQAVSSGEVPSAADMVKTRTPYLDAVLEEILRLGLTAPANIRVTTQDVEVLCYRIPKGVDILMPTSGPGMTAAPMHIEESKRSKSSQLLSAEER